MQIKMSKIDISDLESILKEINENSKIELIGDKSFIDPSFWAILRCEKLKREKFSNKSLEIVADSNFKNSLAYEYLKKINDQKFSSTTIPINDFSQTNIDTADNFAKDFINLLCVNNDDLSSFLQYIIRELITNAIDHSDSLVSTICAGQMFPNIKESEIVVVDGGVGFLSTIKKVHKDIKRDDDAIEKALQKGVSGFSKRSKRYYGYNKNAGFGLYVISMIIKEFGGILKIISKKGVLTLENGDIPKKSLSNDVLWLGSIVIVRLRYDKFYSMTLEKFLAKIRMEDKGEIEDLF